MIMPASPLNWVVVVADGDPVRAGWNRAAQAAGVAAPRFVTWASVLASEAGFRRGEHVFFERLQWQPSNPVGGQRARHQAFEAAVRRLGATLAQNRAGPVPAPGTGRLGAGPDDRDA